MLRNMCCLARSAFALATWNGLNRSLNINLLIDVRSVRINTKKKCRMSVWHASVDGQVCWINVAQTFNIGSNNCSRCHASRIVQSEKSHNAWDKYPKTHHCVTEMCTRAHFGYKVVHSAIWYSCIVRFVRLVYCNMSNICIHVLNIFIFPQSGEVTKTIVPLLWGDSTWHIIYTSWQVILRYYSGELDKLHTCKYG